MKNPAKNIRPLVWKIFAGGLASALALAGCDTQVAGSSVGTGNPTEIQLGFKQDGSAMAITGRVDVYAATQVPVPGYSPLPLTSVPVTDGKSATLTAAALAAIQDSLWPKTSIEGDSIYRFNLVVTGAAQGAILSGFGYRKGKGEFTVRSEDAGAVRSGDAVSVAAALTALTDAHYVIDSTTISPNKQPFLFLYGTGFAAKGQSGKFTFQNLPKGEYLSYLVAIPAKEAIVSAEDSLIVYSTKGAATSGSDILLSVGSPQGMIPLPDSLRKP